MLNESIPTASASTASSTVSRITTSPLSSRPDSSTLRGTNESNPNSKSCSIAWALLVILFAVTNTCNRQFIAYESTSEAKRGGSPRPADRRGRARQARPRGVGSLARGSRDPHAPAPDRSGAQDRPGLERLRRDLATGAGRRRVAHDGPRRPCVLVAVRPDAPHRPASRRWTGWSFPCRRRCTWRRGHADRGRRGARLGDHTGPSTRRRRAVHGEVGRPGARRARTRAEKGDPRPRLWLRREYAPRKVLDTAALEDGDSRRAASDAHHTDKSWF